MNEELVLEKAGPCFSCGFKQFLEVIGINVQADSYMLTCRNCDIAIVGTLSEIIRDWDRLFELKKPADPWVN